MRRLIDGVTDADFAIGRWRFRFKLRARVQSELELVAADLSSSKERSTVESQSRAAVDLNQESDDFIGKVAHLGKAEQPNTIRNVPVESAEQSEQWAAITSLLKTNPHFAIHLAGLRIDDALIEIAGENSPPLGMLVRPKYLVEQNSISQELADATIRLLRIRNTVEASPKFMLTNEIAADFVSKARDLVKELRRAPL
ncbi:MAG: hypothetical protein ACYC19_10685 [Acidimicrobiales bacterium]